MNSSARKGVVGSVENSLEKYIGFDKEGFVFLKAGSEVAITKYPTSNLAKLNYLLNNATETIYVEGIDNSQMINYLDYKGKFENIRSFEMISQYDAWGSQVNGIFLASDHRGTDLPFTKGGTSWVYFFIGTKESGWLAHELYYHAYKYFRNENWGHDRNLIIRNTIEFKNASKK